MLTPSVSPASRCTGYPNEAVSGDLHRGKEEIVIESLADFLIYILYDKVLLFLLLLPADWLIDLLADLLSECLTY